MFPTERADLTVTLLLIEQAETHVAVARHAINAAIVALEKAVAPPFPPVAEAHLKDSMQKLRGLRGACNTVTRSMVASRIAVRS